jgi:hypothetical protein
LKESEDMEKEKSKEPEALPDESLDDATGGLLPAVHTGGANRADITDGTSKTGFLGGVRVASGDVNNDGTALKIADGSVKPGA